MSYLWLMHQRFDRELSLLQQENHLWFPLTDFRYRMVLHQFLEQGQQVFKLLVDHQMIFKVEPSMH